MSFGQSGSGEGMSVGTLTATYKIVQDRQNTNTIGQIVQEANVIRNTLGNVTMRLDTTGFAPEMRAQIAATTEFKNAQRDAAQAQTQLRQGMLQNVQTVGQLRQAQAQAGQTIQQTRLIQQQTAQATQQATAAIQAQNLATAAQRTTTAEAQAAAAAYREEMNRLRLAAMQAGQAVQQQGQAHINLTELVRNSTIAGAAFRAGEDLLQASIRGVDAAIKGSIGGFIEWQQTLQRIQANSTLTTGDIAQMDASIRGMAANAPTDMNKLAQGFRLASDEGFNIAQSQQLANVAMQASVATGANETDTMNNLAVSMHIFHLGTAQAAQTMDLLVESSKLGRLTLEEFVQGTQRAQSVAANYGLTLQDTTAALSAFTRNGYTASQASTQLVGLITHIADPSKEARDELVKLSRATGVDLVSDFSHAGLAAKGLNGVLADVQTVIEKTGDESIISKLVPALRGAQGGYVLLGNGANDYAAIQQHLNGVMTGQSTPVMDAYKQASQTAAFQIGVLKNEVHLFALAIGQYLLPALQAAVTWMQSLLRALGVDFKVPGMEQLKNDTQAVGSAAGDAAAQTSKFNLAAQEDKSKAIMDANNELDRTSGLAEASAAKIRDLTVAANGFKAQMDGIDESMRKIKDDSANALNPLESQLRQVNMISPEEFNRHIQELQLQSQEIELKLAAPDTTAFTKKIDDLKQQILDMGEVDTKSLDTTIDDLRQKLDDFGNANTDAVDKRLETLRGKLQDLGKIATVEIDKKITDLRSQLEGIGDTKVIDRQIEDIQNKLKAPDQSTATQEAGMAALTAQLSGGQIDQKGFDAAYGNLGRQRQAIIENNTTRKTALQQELSDLESKRELQKRVDDDAKEAINDRIKSLELEKAKQVEANTIAKDGIQEQITAAEKERKSIEDQHAADRKALEDQLKAQEKTRKGVVDEFNERKKGLENQVTQQEILKRQATAEYDEKMRVLTSEMDHLKLLDQQAQIHRDILAYPLKQQIDDLKQAETDALAPLQKRKDDLQILIDKNNERLATERANSAELNAQVAAAKELIKTLNGDPTGGGGDGGAGDNGRTPGGPVTPPVPKDRNERQFGGTNGAGGGMAGWLVDLMADIQKAKDDLDPLMANLQKDFSDLLTWGRDHKEDFKEFFGRTWDEIVTTITVAEASISKTVRVMSDLYSHDWQQLWNDIKGETKSSTDANGSMIDQHLGNINKSQEGFNTKNLNLYYLLWKGITDGTSLHWTSWEEEWFGSGGKIGTGFSNLFGKGGTIANFFSDFGTTTNDWFGPDGKIGQKFSSFGTWLQTNFVGGVIKNAFEPGGTFANFFSDAGTTANDWFGDNGKIGQKFDQFGTFIKGFFGENGPIAAAIAGFKNVGRRAINDGVLDPLNGGLDRFAAFVNKIGGGIHDLAAKLHVDINIPTWDAPQIPFLAAGTKDWKGGTAIVGEAGRELGIIDGVARLFDRPTVVNLPAGSVIKSNAETERLLSATAANGANIGGGSGVAQALAQGHGTGNYGLGGIMDMFGNAKDAALGGVRALGGVARDAVSGILGAGLGAAVDGIMAAAGNPSIPLGGGDLAGGIGATVKDVLMQGLKDMWDSVTGALPKAQNLGTAFYSGHGTPRGDAGALAPLRDLIEGSAGKYGVPDWLIGSLIMHESGGQIGRIEDGGGYGRGLMQVDIGPANGWQYKQFEAQLTGKSMEDAAFQIDLGTSILANKPGSGWPEKVQNYAGRGYSVSPTGFYDELVAGYKDAVAAVLRGELTGPPTPGGNGDVVAQAAKYIGQVSSGGMTDDGLWSGWCERFVEFMNQFAGTGLHSGTFGSAAIHMRNSMTNTDDNPPPGASVFFYGNGWGGEFGHVGVAVGDGTVISTTGLIGSGTPIRRSSGWLQSDGYQGWAPPGMKLGGVFATPTVVTVGDVPGRVPEIIAPQPMLKQSVKDAIIEMGRGGGGGDVIFQAGSIVQMPGEDAEALANRVAERVRRNMQRGGKNGI